MHGSIVCANKFSPRKSSQISLYTRRKSITLLDACAHRWQSCAKSHTKSLLLASRRVRRFESVMLNNNFQHTILLKTIPKLSLTQRCRQNSVPRSARRCVPFWTDHSRFVGAIASQVLACALRAQSCVFCGKHTVRVCSDGANILLIWVEIGELSANRL